MVTDLGNFVKLSDDMALMHDFCKVEILCIVSYD